MDEADYVVIGGGSGGSVLASRLSDDPSTKVVLLEAGGEGGDLFVRTPIGIAAMLPTRIHNWGFSTVPQPGLGGRTGYQPRGRGLGGSSAINAMVYIRGHASDYADWGPGWSYQDLLPYFLRSENNERLGAPWHGKGGPLNVADLRTNNRFVRHFLDAAKEAGFPANDDFNGAEQEGVGPYQVTQKNGERCSVARAYLDPVRHRGNLRIETRARADRILIEDGRAVGVELTQGGEKRRIMARREVLLAAGAIQSPQILMLSGIGPAEHLKGFGIEVKLDLPGVGQNLRDHPDFIFAYRAKSLDLLGFSPAGGLHMSAELLRYVRERRGMVSSNVAEAGGFLKTEPNLTAPDIQLHFVIGILEDHGRRLHAHHGFSCHTCLLRPKSRGSIQLASADPADAPLIDPAFYQDPEDLEGMVRGFKLTRRIMDAPSLKVRRGRELFTEGIRSDDEIKAVLRQRSDTIYHPVGSCAIGSVVDHDLKVKGLSGVRVADASIMPTLIGGNTNAPVVAFAEKAVDLISKDNQ